MKIKILKFSIIIVCAMFSVLFWGCTESEPQVHQINFNVDGFSLEQEGNFLQNINVSDYNRLLEYDGITSVDIYNGNTFIVGQEVESLILEVKSQHNKTYVRYNLNTPLDTSTVGEGVFNYIVGTKTIPVKYEVLNAVGIELYNEFLTEYALGFEYDFSSFKTEVNFILEDGTKIRGSVYLSGYIFSDSVGEKEIQLTYKEYSIPFKYEVFGIKEIQLQDDVRSWYSADNLPTFVSTRVIMSNDKEFYYCTIDVSDIDVSVPGHYTKQLEYLGFTLDYEYDVLEISSVEVANTQRSLFYLNENFYSEVGGFKIEEDEVNSNGDAEEIVTDVIINMDPITIDYEMYPLFMPLTTAIPLSVTYSNGKSEIVNINIDDANLTMDGFYSDVVHSGVVDIGYYGIHTHFNYEVVDIEGVEFLDYNPFNISQNDALSLNINVLHGTNFRNGYKLYPTVIYKDDKVNVGVFKFAEQYYFYKIDLIY